MPAKGPYDNLEPLAVQEARAIIREWKLRYGHSSYVEPLGGGYTGYQARCWDCDWNGPEHLRGDEEMSTPESRAHKRAATQEAIDHQAATKPAQLSWEAETGA